jgi:putative heme-binding domain-containing protein
MLSLFLLSATLLIATGKGTAAVTPPDQIKVPAGFKVELLREAGPDEGSWICMTQDDKGRLYISTQGAPKGVSTKDQGKWGGMWRAKIVMTENPTGNIQPHVLEWEKVNVPVGDAMGMLWAFDSLYVSGNGPQGRGIYRCTSSKHDDHLDYATLFKAIPGGAGEHGAHAIVLGPDKKLYIINGNSTGILDGLAPDSPYRNWGEDDLLPRLRDPVATFFDKIKAPYGCVYRTDADGTKWELFAGGFRNPYDIAFNPDGELFTYDADMEWDRGLPWYRPTRILHVVPGGEYGFREGSAKWPAYFPDSLPAVADIGVGCPTGMKFGTDAKGWPEKYRRALFLHDWTYGRILAVTLHEKGASYTARNDLASYTYPRDAEANGDVEVFLSGKGMPVTDMEFLRDGSMVFTVGGRGTAAALYRVSYVSGAPSGAHRDSAGDPVVSPPANILRPSGTNAGASSTSNPPANNAPEAQRKLAGGAASEASATTGSPSAKASAPDGARETVNEPSQLALPVDERGAQEKLMLWSMFGSIREIGTHRGLAARLKMESAGNTALRQKAIFAREADFALPSLLASARVDTAEWQDAMLALLGKFPLSSWLRDGFPPSELSDNLKLTKLRVLELSFARQGRPSEEWVKAVMEELLAHYPAPPIPANAVTPARNPAAGAPVDAPAWRLNRELCQLLVWLSNPELGELNADLIEKAKGGAGNSGFSGQKEAFSVADVFQSAEPARQSEEFCRQNAQFLRQNSENWRQNPENWRQNSEDWRQNLENGRQNSRNWRQNLENWRQNSQDWRQNSEFLRQFSASGNPVFVSASLPAQSDREDRADGAVAAQDVPLFAKATPAPWQPFTFPSAARVGGVISLDGGTAWVEWETETFGKIISVRKDIAPSLPTPLLAQAAPAAGKADTLPTEAPPVPAGSRPASLNSGLGPVPNPGAAIFPGRKGAAFHAELGRQVIEKTLALMDAAPSQEEQVWYALCLRWAHGWTPELRVRYFRWFHEKAARYTGGNSFTKFVEAIRADAASRVPEADRAALAEWMHPVATPAPAVLKPRDFVKAWTLPELEAALDKLKDRKPDLARGKDLYTQAQCAQCHLFRDAGGNVGPDLTAVAQRFGRHDILESITDPSKVIGDQYAMITLTILDGKGGTSELSGLVKEESSATITLLTDPLAGKTANLYKNVIVKREKSAVSIMPPGLLYTLTAEEVADLLALFGAK